MQKKSFKKFIFPFLCLALVLSFSFSSVTFAAYQVDLFSPNGEYNKPQEYNTNSYMFFSYSPTIADSYDIMIQNAETNKTVYFARSLRFNTVDPGVQSFKVPSDLPIGVKLRVDVNVNWGDFSTSDRQFMILKY